METSNSKIPTFCLLSLTTGHLASIVKAAKLDPFNGHSLEWFRSQKQRSSGPNRLTEKYWISSIYNLALWQICHQNLINSKQLDPAISNLLGSQEQELLENTQRRRPKDCFGGLPLTTPERLRYCAICQRWASVPPSGSSCFGSATWLFKRLFWGSLCTWPLPIGFHFCLGCWLVNQHWSKDYWMRIQLFCRLRNTNRSHHN